MKIICCIKYVPNVDNFNYNYENNTLIRENVRLILNPDDLCAVSYALQVKLNQPNTTIEVVTMGPLSVKPYVEDLIRIGVDKATIITDRLFAGSDTYVTSKIISTYLLSQDYDIILTGTHAIDGDTAHVPSQIGAILDINQMSNVVQIKNLHFDRKIVTFAVDTDQEVTTYQMKLPAILSLTRESKYKLPYMSRENMYKDVSKQLCYVSNKELRFHSTEVGLKGSPTKVFSTYTKQFNTKEKIIVKADDEGIDVVFNYLIKKGFL